MNPARPHPPRTSAHLGRFVLAAVALHAGVGLALGLHLHAQAMLAGGPTRAPIDAPMHWRWVAHAPQAALLPTLEEPRPHGPTRGWAGGLPGTAVDPEPARATALGPTPEVATDASVAASVSTGFEAAPTPAPDQAQATASIGADVADASATGLAAATEVGETTSDYARRDTLDRGPQALGIVQIDFPPGVEPGRVHTGHLTLLIDETGAVRKVMPMDHADTDDALPPPFMEAARMAFLQARFAPGERHGVAVKSRIDIEVSFDDREDQASATTAATASPKSVASADRPA